jgi:hypothetical protein
MNVLIGQGRVAPSRHVGCRGPVGQPGGASVRVWRESVIGRPRNAVGREGNSVAVSRQDGLDPVGAQTPQAFLRLLLLARNESGLSIVEIVERARERGRTPARRRRRRAKSVQYLRQPTTRVPYHHHHHPLLLRKPMPLTGARLAAMSRSLNASALTRDWAEPMVRFGRRAPRKPLDG